MKSKAAKTIKGLKRGETIIEVLVALVVVTIGAATATSLIVTSLRANQFNKDSLVALNLAQEGVEYMHNLRDTNWIKFSGNPQACWNTQPNLATCGPANLLAETTATTGYSLGLDASSNNTLTLLAKPLNLLGTDAIEEGYRLNYFDLNNAVNSDNLDRTDSASLPGTQDDYDYIGSAYPGHTVVDKTKFYRSIEVQYKSIAIASPWTVTPAASPGVADMMVVTSTVDWLDSGVQHEVKLSSALTRYK